MEENTIQGGLSNLGERQRKAGKKSAIISVKTAIIIAAIIIIGTLAYVYRSIFIVATVDGSPITRLAVIKELEKASGKSLLDSLINKKLVENETRAKKIAISDDEVNGEIKKIEDQIVAQGNTLEAALAAQGMDMEDLKERIIFQKEVEKLIADKLSVTDGEVAQYIKNNKISIPAGQEVVANDQIKNEIRNQKLNTEATALITDLKAKADIKYLADY